MIVEFNVNYLKNYYSDAYDINTNYENKYDELKTILSDKIDNDNINSEILHIFPITLSCVVTMLVSIYLYV